MASLLRTAPRLHVRRPSPTAAEFTVTTEPPPTLRLRLLSLAVVALRLTLCLAVLLVLHSQWCASASGCARLLSLSRPLTLAAPRSSLLWPWPCLALARLPAPALLALLAATLYLVGLGRAHARESLLVLRGLGVQTTEAPVSFFSPASLLSSPFSWVCSSGAATRFIPTEKIHDILLNEAFRGFEVRYYLVVVVEGEQDVVVVFPGLLPPRHIVETVWRGARQCLYEGRTEDKGG
ncbi:hypothetical protein CDD81_6123 [Ophiocordyceps australis]|uniref:Phosphatidylinositol N-acetylglucosaminyltransferase subunit H conserved domain-containing protein n=1 Tax=Ophiocordyceps australis TaxID=1399860 RepID=A0A2C5Y6D5_9HYPO|nr:hypothetical protein CDD81_6123 [Ophiocordyceps australis]